MTHAELVENWRRVIADLSIEFPEHATQYRRTKDDFMFIVVNTRSSYLAFALSIPGAATFCLTQGPELDAKMEDAIKTILEFNEPSDHAKLS